MPVNTGLQILQGKIENSDTHDNRVESDHSAPFSPICLSISRDVVHEENRSHQHSYFEEIKEQAEGFMRPPSN